MLKALRRSSIVGRSGSIRYAKLEGDAVHVIRLTNYSALMKSEAFDDRWLATLNSAITPHTSIAAVAVGSNIVSS